jgi:hypothetical protein
MPARCWRSSPRLARLADDLPEVAKLDLNPVLALSEGCVVVDARIRLQARSAVVRSRAGKSAPAITAAARRMPTPVRVSVA